MLGWFKSNPEVSKLKLASDFIVDVLIADVLGREVDAFSSYIDASAEQVIAYADSINVFLKCFRAFDLLFSTSVTVFRG